MMESQLEETQSKVEPPAKGLAGKPESLAVDEPILKERKKPNFTPEYRAQLSARMKEVNAARIAKSRAANKDKMVAEVEAKEEKRKAMEAELTELRKKVAMQEEVKKRVKKEPPAKRVQQVKVISMPDPEDNTDDDMSDVDIEPKVVIVKQKAKAKPKKEEPPPPPPAAKPAPPAQRFKFL